VRATSLGPTLFRPVLGSCRRAFHPPRSGLAMRSYAVRLPSSILRPCNARQSSVRDDRPDARRRKSGRKPTWEAIGPGGYAACARMGAWNTETPSSGPRKAKHGWKPLGGSPRKGGRGSATTPQRKPSPASLSNCACNRPKKPTITRTGASCSWGIPTLKNRG
jgi:hypothetical protein